MGRDGDDGDLFFLRAIAPEYAVRSGRLVLRICLKDLFLSIEGIGERIVFVGLKPWVTRVLSQ